MLEIYNLILKIWIMEISQKVCLENPKISFLPQSRTKVTCRLIKCNCISVDPTTTWFEHAMELYEQRGQHGSYFQQKFGDLLERKRRGADTLAECKCT